MKRVILLLLICLLPATAAIGETACRKDAEGQVTCEPADAGTDTQPGASRDELSQGNGAEKSENQKEEKPANGPGEFGGQSNQNRANGITY